MSELITGDFLLGLGWVKDESLNDRTYYFEKSNFTIEIGREWEDSECIIHDEYGYHDGLRYSGKIPTKEQYQVLNQLLSMHE